MFLLVINSFEEQRRDLLVAFLLGLGCKIGVLVARLGLTGKGSQQVFFRFEFLRISFLSCWILLPVFLLLL